MIRNKKGLSDIVTTVLIILLVAVAVAAVWAFVSPSLRGTGTQFTKTQTCISNVVEPIECKIKGTSTNPDNYPVDIRVRRTLSDGVAVLSGYTLTIGTTSSKEITSSNMFSSNYTTYQGSTITISSSGKSNDGLAVKYIVPNAQDAGPALTDTTKVGSSTTVTVTSRYTTPDQTVIECKSLPTTCTK